MSTEKTVDETVVTTIGRLDDGDKKPYFTIVKGSRLGQIYALDKAEMVVGRSQEADLRIEDIAISRKHFKIYVNNNQVTVEDLASTNGTHVNGSKVTRQALADGDKIQISRNTIFELSYLDESQSLSEKKRYEMGVMDPVCEIHNKRYFLERLNEEFNFSKRKKRVLSLIMFDIDHFKKLNDTYGHIAGDAVLKKVSQLITKIIRTDDIFARYGGEEFVLILRDTDEKNAANLAERIRVMISRHPFLFDGKEVNVTISLGVTELHESMPDATAFIEKADKFLYESKANGRNKVTSGIA
ncbi:diguanylate cyclase [bacterium]|nr:diguanylate cyclase [bacterium]